MRRLLAMLAAMVLGAAGSRAEPSLQIDGAFLPGGLVSGQAEPGATVTLDGRAIRVAADGRFILGFGRDAAPSALLRIVPPDGGTLDRTLAISRRRFEVQHIDGLPQEQVAPDPGLMQRIRREADLMTAARASGRASGFPEERMIWPVRGPISGVYGSQRILNGEPRQPHFGVDIAADPGTSVGAAAGGVVALAEPDLFLTGGTVVIDHGFGLSTTYAHLSAVDVAVGQRLGQGERVGAVGATGRATGPHLHWGTDWFEVRLDPALLAGPMPEQNAVR